MGPLPERVGSGRPCGSAPSTGPARFNGAAPGRERKTPPPPNGRPRSPSRSMASMGPLPVGSGRPRQEAQPTQSFNGAAPGRERKTGHQEIHRGRGPGSWGRSRSERKNVPRAAATLHLASMGPLPVGSGRRRVGRVTRNTKGFNGAAPGRERKTLGPQFGCIQCTSFNGAAPGRERKTQQDMVTGRVAQCASMGPLPVGSGRRPSITWTLLRRRFNGAAPGRERKTAPRMARPRASMGPLPVGSGRPGRRRPGQLQTGFNGAAPGRERKTQGRGHAAEGRLAVQWGRSRSGAEEQIGGSHCGSVTLQWGRSRSGAEDVRAGCPRRPGTKLQWGRSRSGAEDARGGSTRRGGPASMGPLPVGSGRRPGRRRRRSSRQRASMGPLPVGSGRPDCPANRVWGRRASMGPLPVGSGRPIMEADEIRRDGLQWGRSRSGAEDDIGCADVAGEPIASMGPLPVGSGRPGSGQPAFGVSGFNGAAPGRERKTSQTARASSCRRGFNGAAPGRERKTGYWSIRLARGPCFNGAAPGRERKTADAMDRLSTPHRFNGAAPGRERKTLGRRRPPRPRLQWGRSRSGAEDAEGQDISEC